MSVSGRLPGCWVFPEQQLFLLGVPVGRQWQKPLLPVWHELAGASSWVTGLVQNICRQHHPLKETSMYVGSKIPRPGTPAFSTSSFLKWLGNPCGHSWTQPANFCVPPHSPLLSTGGTQDGGSALQGATAISWGLPSLQALQQLDKLSF